MRAIYILGVVLAVGVFIGLVIAGPLFESISAFLAGPLHTIPVDFDPFSDDLYI